MSSSNSQAFCLKLNSHQPHLIQSFQKLYHDEVMVDCTISCPGGHLKAHKLVLSACSPYFADIFSTFTNPYQYPVVVMKDIPYADLKVIIEFMYKGQITVPQSILASVLESAKSLSVTGLSDIEIAKFDQSLNKLPGGSGILTKRAGSQKRRLESSNNGTKDAVSVSAEENSMEIVDNSKDDVSANEDEQEELSEERAADILNEIGQGFADVGEEVGDLTGNNESTVSDFTFEDAQEPQPSTSVEAIVTDPSPRDTLKAKRIAKLQNESGGFSVTGGRKMWTPSEMETLMEVWNEEMKRIWATGRTEPLSMQKISTSLQAQGVDRDVSQVEGKIKSLKRDFKTFKSNQAIPAVHKRIVPYLDKLEVIFSHDQTE